MKQIKIAYIIDSIETTTAGTENQLVMLLEGINSDEFKPYLICLRNSEWLDNYNPPFPKIILNINRLISFKIFSGMKKLIKFFKKEEMDIVQTFFFDTNIFGIIAARLAGIKIRIAGRRTHSYPYNRKILLILRFLSKLTTHYIANSRAVSDYVIQNENVNPEKLHIIYNGLNPSHFDLNFDELRNTTRKEWNISENEILIGIVSNLRPVKNINLFVEAAIKLSCKYDNLRFIIIGEGIERNPLQQKINHNKLNSKIEMVGTIKIVLYSIPAFDIAVLTSLSEGLSNTVLEYMGCGLPIVASDIDSNKELISHKKTGLLFESNNLNDLIVCLERLISDKSESKLLGDNAKDEVFYKFNIESYINNHETLYKKLLRK